MTGTTRKLTGVIASRQTLTILVHEWVTGGGLADSPLPPSWAAEGGAMRRAIAGDFAALDGGRARVVATLDARLGEAPVPWAVERIGAGDHPRRILDLAERADLTILIAPEATGILADLTRRVQETRTRLLGSSADAVALAGDKAALAGHLAARGINTPTGRIIAPRDGLPRDLTYPAVLKPPDGAGTVDTFFLEDPHNLPEEARRMPRALLQPLVIGRPMSASFLVDSAGRGWPLAIGEQHVVIRHARFEYRGGLIPSATPVDDRPMRLAVESVPGLHGFVGVDFVWDDRRRQATVLEINPRPTTSIVGLVRLLPPGRLASAWIAAGEPGLSGEGRLRDLPGLIGASEPIAFQTTGTISAS